MFPRASGILCLVVTVLRGIGSRRHQRVSDSDSTRDHVALHSALCAGGADQRGRTLGGVFGGVAGLLLLALLPWCLLRRRRRMHVVRGGLAKGSDSHTSVREAADSLDLKTALARPMTLLVRAPRLEHTLCSCAGSGSTHARLCVSTPPTCPRCSSICAHGNTKETRAYDGIPPRVLCTHTHMRRT